MSNSDYFYSLINQLLFINSLDINF